MDAEKFDDFARALGSVHSRRRFFRTLAGGAAAALLGARGPEPAAAAGCNKAGAGCGGRKKCCTGLTCQNGACCPPAQVCGDACCPVGYACQNGACVAGGGGGTGCPAGQARCNGACTDLATPANCGACGKACPASTDPCQAAACLNGACGFRPANAGGRCDDGSACTKNDVCQADGSCTGTPITCDDGLACTDDSCDPVGGCRYTLKAGRCLIDGVCSASGDRNPGNPCQQCDPAASQTTWTNAPRGTPCADADRCDGDEACDGAGTCSPGTPVTCGQCTACNAEAGTCVPAFDGQECDGDPTDKCKQRWRCGGGLCQATGHIICPESFDPCRDTGTCDPATGLCSNPPKRDGTACDDGNACTRSDTCQAGVCRAGLTFNPCLTFNRCLTGGHCDPATGACVGQTQHPDGETCTPVQTDLCIETGVCQAGQCAPVSPDCSAFADQCNDGGCDESTGSCRAIAKPDGLPCTVQDDCDRTHPGGCQQGTCVRTDPPNCNNSDPCAEGPYTCGTFAGGPTECLGTSYLPVGTPCGDNKACTDRFLGGELHCSGPDGTPVDCTRCAPGCASGYKQCGDACVSIDAVCCNVDGVAVVCGAGQQCCLGQCRSDCCGNDGVCGGGAVCCPCFSGEPRCLTPSIFGCPFC